MITRKISVLCMALLFFGALNAQNVEFKSSNFKDDKDGLKAATDHIDKGDEYLEKGNEAVVLVNNIKDHFHRALYHYLKANDFNPNNAELNYKIGNAYLYTNEKYKARKHLDKAIKLNPDLDPKINIYLGLAYQLDGKYNEAITFYRKFETTAKSKNVEEYKSA